MFDILQTKPQEAAGVYMGLNSIGKNQGIHNWQSTSGSSTGYVNGDTLIETYRSNI